VAIICGIDTMKAESANAMLKTLEEPPKDTLLILCTDRPHAVLPTVLSRCQVLRFGYLEPGRMAEALGAMHGREPGDPEIANAVRCAGGSLGRARALMSQPLDEQLSLARVLLALCGESDWLRVAEALEALVAGDLNHGRDYGAAERILTYSLQVIRDAVVGSGTSGQNYFSENPSSRLPAAIQDPETARRLVGLCQEAIDGVRARGNVLLVMATFVLGMREVVHEQEQ
jgi:hypothetical protein